MYRKPESDILANSTKPAVDSKINSYVTLCRAWQVAAWPVSLQSIQCFAASLKEGGYRSAQTYFHSVFSYQRRTLQIEVEGLVKQTAKDYARSIGRGLGPASLKDSFDVDLLASIPPDRSSGSFDINDRDMDATS